MERQSAGFTLHLEFRVFQRSQRSTTVRPTAETSQGNSPEV